MKTVKIQGGLGNQLFGLAFARSVARLGGAPVALDVAAYRADRYGHGFAVGDLAARFGEFDIVERPLLGSRGVTRLARALSPPGYVPEGAPPVSGAALRALAARGDYFNGYWQNEAYIADADGFRRQLRDWLIGDVAPAAARDIVIHCRTYQEEIRPGAARGPTSAYFRRALAAIEAKSGAAGEVCLVSDDLAIARERLGDIGREVIPLAGAGAWGDLALLMKARALILTNSSFSWWGGFCGEAGIVAYPRREGVFHYPEPAARFTVL